MGHSLPGLVHRLGRVVARDGLAQLTDGELLRRFTADRDALAFEALVWRHGPMVLGTCARVLGRTGDVEDAFQATFLTLVRRARTVRSGEALAGWLHRVARRVSVRLDRDRDRRTTREQHAARPEAVSGGANEWADWRAALDREVERLPEPYRAAFVLCHLEGRAQEDAARELGCPVGTLQSRLARAKERLRARLPACGVALPVLGAGTVSARLTTATVTAAVEFAAGSRVAVAPDVLALSQGMWKPMIALKSKVVFLALVVTAVVGAGGGSGGGPATVRADPPPARPDPTIEELKKENTRLRLENFALLQRLLRAEKALDPPTDDEVIKALPKAPPGAARDDIVIVKDKLLERLDPAKQHPNVGQARLRHQHWECSVYFTETVTVPWPIPVQMAKKRVSVVYIDKDVLIPVGGAKQ
ncbi:sigma-70 family rna polymerase sigma factor : RNA polymerase sigma factor, sigma-70 family OS=Singulisphaera acidiphila (strain ATCC BAA-1392 / DSM 18658 / VKM B-2454 / MOB10) GN=Sinac_6419 PE=4 SV=1: Sigma70_r2: Sigma70_r4_2 [Gemmata massiliana]|uniref:RNA polymerase sigma-70 region 2 domain-containing protein n=1 Tax=Gemmata massiliana TaxID=1210884 RepID=A0A6P2CZU0_9BACT|nr:RNA polymerase sigma factor [Gemmata massiliana]VTR93324.1 sigma-70 family rna polymerase sigma factor : RNA polymerase sigma factor, sigma-70 family OS=Singulisphaera acidiphila (strain ATCC BAA-1392 / DSM 18658 / VKM B-2454 / MOB10) GN=Sinac_6419 PE=4 SV=1: Sigma70_r2: Sigma70_r4_2 [Gemmata massiliana]